MLKRLKKQKKPQAQEQHQRRVPASMRSSLKATVRQTSKNSFFSRCRRARMLAKSYLKSALEEMEANIEDYVSFYCMRTVDGQNWGI